MKYSFFLRAGLAVFGALLVSCQSETSVQLVTNTSPEKAKPLPGWIEEDEAGGSDQQLVISTKVIEVTRQIDSEDIPSERYERKFTDEEFEKFMRGLNQIKGTDILTAPKVVVRDGQKAFVRIGKDFVYPVENSLSEESEPAIANHVTEEVGVISHVGAHHLGGQEISLKTFTRISEFDGFSEASAKQDLPCFTRRDVEAFSTLKSGETLVIGGLVDEKVQSVEDVKLFGLITDRYQKKLSRELIIAVTAELAK